MLSKQITSKLKEEQERENQSNPSYSNTLQCDRLIRTVSCKHDANHAIRKTNINVLQSFDEIKLYVSPNISSNVVNLDETDQTNKEIITRPNSSKLPRRNQSFKLSPSQNEEIKETDLKDVLDRIFESLCLNNISQLFSSKVHQQDDADASASGKLDLIESIQYALNHIDYNLKRNSDFINELTKLLDTSRAIKQEAQLKKLLKSLEDEKNATNLNQTTSLSQPPSPLLRTTNAKEKDIQSLKEEDKQKKQKSKSFRGISFNRSKSSAHSSQSSLPPVQVTEANQKPPTNYLTLPGSPQQQSARLSSAASSITNLESSFQKQLKLNSQTHEINNSDYTELEIEVEKISYYLENLTRHWSKIAQMHKQETHDQLKYSIEFQTLINNLNSSYILKELEQSLFKLNWLITSKSGFSEPNWKTNVLSITPSTFDSFIGVNLLKNYYKYVKYDFVSYKLFTRQLQLIQICAIILSLIHRILLYFKESSTLSSITNSLNGLSSQPGQNSNFFNDALNPSLLSFTFSADKYKPISWSANHVTLYNVASARSNLDNNSTNNQEKSSTILNRAGSFRDTRPFTNREDHIKQIKNDLFLNELKEFINISTERLNLQASLTNRTGYFYIVNQSTGLVLQAVDFTSQSSLKEQIEENQKRLQNSSIKGRVNSGSKSPSMINKGPRFYLMPKTNSSTTTNPVSLSNETANDEQLWYYYLINGCVANKIIRSGHCMAASSLNAKSPVTFWPNVKTTNCSWFFNHHDQTIVSGLSDELVLDYIIIDEPPNQRYAVVIDTRVPNKASQKWSFEFC